MSQLLSDRDKLDEQNTILFKLHQHLVAKNRFPHSGQAKIIRAIFNDKKKVVQGQCGRSLGKTEAILYCAWRFATTNPGVEVYIVCPEQSQGKKIYWIPRRLQNYGPQEFVAEHRDSELRTVFKNGSHIMVVGCENYEALRGIKPHFVIYDEFQHHTQYFDEEVMQPNLSSGKVSLLVMGTPPKRHCYYIEFMENVRERIAAADPNYFYMELPSSDNPTLDQEWLKNKRQELIRRGKYNVWLREYEGKLVFDTEHAVFPFFDEKRHVRPHETLMRLIQRDKKKLEWYALFDPGTATVFGGLFIAVNRFTSQIFYLGEIYATDKREMTARAVWDKSNEIKESLHSDEDDWTDFYDEAATWFANEIQQMFDKGLIPTQKKRSEEKRMHDEGRAGESILNTLMMEENKWFVSDRCVKFIWEITNYVVNELGQYPKKHDHLIDLMFYHITNTHFELLESPDPSTFSDEFKAVRRKKDTIQDAFVKNASKGDHLHDFEPEYYDYGEEELIWN